MVVSKRPQVDLLTVRRCQRFLQKHSSEALSLVLPLDAKAGELKPITGRVNTQSAGNFFTSNRYPWKTLQAAQDCQNPPECPWLARLLAPLIGALLSSGCREITKSAKDSRASLDTSSNEKDPLKVLETNLSSVNAMAVKLHSATCCDRHRHIDRWVDR